MMKPFKRFSLWEFLRGSGIYRFQVFYDVKDILMRYDERRDYVNYGYWRDGDDTAQPSALLVQHVAAKLRLAPEDILLNVGSGLGQPDVDILHRFGPLKKIIGINISPEQVRYANDRFKSLNLSHLIEHRVLSADRIADDLSGDGVTCIVGIEVIEEIALVERFIESCYEILPKGGRITLCGLTLGEVGDPRFFKRLLRSFFLRMSALTYGNDRLRPVAAYVEQFKKAGFTDIRHESVGGKVFPYVYRHAKKNFPVLMRTQHIPLVVKILAYLDVLANDRLFAWSQIDYGVFVAEKH